MPAPNDQPNSQAETCSTKLTFSTKELAEAAITMLSGSTAALPQAVRRPTTASNATNGISPAIETSIQISADL